MKNDTWHATLEVLLSRRTQAGWEYLLIVPLLTKRPPFPADPRCPGTKQLS